MDFQNFLNKPAREIDLLKQLAETINAQYDRYKGQFYLLRAEKADGELVRIVSVNSFSDHLAYSNYVIALKRTPAGLSAIFKDDRFDLICAGFFVHAYATVWPDKIELEDPVMDIATVDPRLVIPDEPLILSGFRDLGGHFQSAKLTSKKPGAA